MMNKRINRAISLILSLFLLTLFVLPASAKTGAESKPDVKIVYTDSNGAKVAEITKDTKKIYLEDLKLTKNS